MNDSVLGQDGSWDWKWPLSRWNQTWSQLYVHIKVAGSCRYKLGVSVAGSCRSRLDVSVAGGCRSRLGVSVAGSCRSRLDLVLVWQAVVDQDLMPVAGSRRSRFDVSVVGSCRSRLGVWVAGSCRSRLNVRMPGSKVLKMTRCNRGGEKFVNILNLLFFHLQHT